MDYLTDIKPLEDAGQTDAEIAASLKASGVTHNIIDRADLMHLLNILGMLTRVVEAETQARWTGTILNMQAAVVAAGTAEEVAALRTWLSHITNVTNVTWDTTNPLYSAAFWSLYQNFADQPTMPTTADFQAIAALGGGFKFENVDEGLVAVARLEYLDAQANVAREDELKALQIRIDNDFINPALADNSQSVATVIAAIKAGL